MMELPKRYSTPSEGGRFAPILEKVLAAQLGDRGFHVVSLSGDLSQSERTNALQSMREFFARQDMGTACGLLIFFLID
jgi:hypothetical protein